MYYMRPILTETPISAMRDPQLLRKLDAMPFSRKVAIGLVIGIVLAALEFVGLPLGRWLINGIIGVMLVLVTLAGIVSIIALILGRCR